MNLKFSCCRCDISKSIYFVTLFFLLEFSSPFVEYYILVIIWSMRCLLIWIDIFLWSWTFIMISKLEIVHKGVPDPWPHWLFTIVCSLSFGACCHSVFSYIVLIEIFLFQFVDCFLVRILNFTSLSRKLTGKIKPNLFSTAFKNVEYFSDTWLLLLQLQVTTVFTLSQWTVLELALELILDVANVLLKFDTKFLGFRYSNFLAFVTTLKTSFDVHVVVFDDPKDNVRCRDSFSSLCSSEHS